MLPPFFSRRQFLVMAASAVGGALVPSVARAAFALSPKMLGERCLHLYNTHTGEFFKEPYWVQGSYLTEALKKIDFLLRDHRTDEQKAILPALLDVLHRLQVKLDYQKKAVDVISGFRSLATNRMLCKKSKNVARRSLHMEGAAIDLRFTGVPLTYVHKAACSLQAGGVGYYPKPQFIHIDVRPRIIHWKG